MKIGDLVKHNYEEWIGIIVDFCTMYNKYGEPYEKYLIVNWGLDYPNEQEHPSDVEVINENR